MCQEKKVNEQMEDLLRAFTPPPFRFGVDMASSGRIGGASPRTAAAIVRAEAERLDREAKDLREFAKLLPADESSLTADARNALHNIVEDRIRE